MVPDAVLPSPTIDRLSETHTDAVARESRRRVFGIAESWAAALALGAILALRVAYACVYRVDSDEPQHLHVVWGWVHGLLPYRDLFDNHSPLFQMLCSPLMRALGEHAWIVVPMRLAMLPFYVADLWLIYLIGRSLYVQRWGVWMALVAGCVPKFFLVTAEFRPDDLWTTLWLVAVWLAVTGPVTGRRAFIFGLTMGACFAVSMKTMLLLASMGVGGAGLLALHPLSRRRTEFVPMLKAGVLIAAGLIIIPALVIGFFAAQGALGQMYYCVLQHNALPGLGKWAKSGLHQWLFPLSLPVLLGLGWLCMHSSASERIGSGRALILMTGGAYYFLLRSYWPLVTSQDYATVLPLLALSALPFLFHLLSLTGWPARVFIPAVSLLLLAGETAWLWRSQSLLDNRMAEFEQPLAIVLRLTNPDDFVMDSKGEAIFRNRPTYWVMEGVTLRRMKMGLIPYDLKEKVIQTGTHLALNHRMQPGDQKWLRSNFLEGDGKVWVAGKNLGPARPSMTFRTDIRGSYSIVSNGGKLAGTIDGAPLRDSQQVPAGTHRLELAAGTGEVDLVWTQALDRGFNPFTKKIAGITD
jgi:hypothetical protein